MQSNLFYSSILKTIQRLLCKQEKAGGAKKIMGLLGPKTKNKREKE